MKNIERLILEDMQFKMKFWRAVAIGSTLLIAIAWGLFLAQEFELEHLKNENQALKNGTQDYYCEKGIK